MSKRRDSTAIRRRWVEFVPPRSFAQALGRTNQRRNSIFSFAQDAISKVLLSIGRRLQFDRIGAYWMNLSNESCPILHEWIK